MTFRSIVLKKPFQILAGLLLVAYYSMGLLSLAASASGKDLDRDGMPNRWEANHGLNPSKPNAKGDPDGDGLKNLGEWRHRTNPKDADTDDDELDDREEVKDLDTDPKDADTDDDGTADGDEDSDGDGIENSEDENDDDQGDDETEDECDEDDEAEDDADEAEDDETDDDCEDAENTGRIVSYNSDTNMLTIDPDAPGDNVTGEVTDETELEWEFSDGSDSEATEDDLDPGQDVADYELDEGEYDEVGLKG